MIVDSADDAGGIDVFVLGIDQVGHKAYYFPRGKVIPGLFVGLLVKPADQLLKHVAHVMVADPVRVQVDFRISIIFDDQIQPVGLVQLLDLRLEAECLEHGPGRLGKAVDVAGQDWWLCSPDRPKVFQTYLFLFENRRMSGVLCITTKLTCRF